MKLCFDTTLMRPGCVLLAAALGADTELAKQFDPSTWLLAPTPDLRVYNITEEQFAELKGRVK